MACTCIEQVRNRVSRSDPTVWTDAGSLPEGQCESHGGAAEAGQLTTMCMSPHCHMIGHVQMEAMAKMKNISELLHSKHYRDSVRCGLYGMRTSDKVEHNNLSISLGYSFVQIKMQHNFNNTV